MSLGEGEDAIFDRELIRKVEIAAADAAAERGLQASGAEGNVGFKILKEETGGKLVVGVVKFAVPVSGELIVGVGAGLADSERHGTVGGRSRGHIGQRK